MSGGFIIFISGHKRFCYKYSTLLYHGVRGWHYGTIPTVKTDYDESIRQQEIINSIIVEKTKITKEILEKYNEESKDWYISAEEVLKLGIADEML